MVPDRVVIGGQEVEIIGHRERMDRRRGDTNFYTNVINYDVTQSEGMKEQTICHEIVHQLLDKSGVRIILEDRDQWREDKTVYSLEEALCCGLENIFWRFLKDNTEIFGKDAVVMR